MNRSTGLLNRNVVLLWQGQFVSQIGNQIFDIALVLWVVQATGSAAVTGLLLMASNIPLLLLTPIGGVLADRYSRKRLIVASDLLSGILVLSLAALLAVAPASQQLIIGWIFVVSVGLSILQSAFMPAISAAIPDLVPSERMASANSLFQVQLQIALLVGQALGGVLFRVAGAAVLFLVNGVSFLFSAASEAFVEIPQRGAGGGATWRERVAEVRRDLDDGLRFIWANAGLRALVLISAAGAFFSAPLILLLPFFVQDVLGVGSEWYGFLLAGFGLGALAGFVLAGLLSLSGARRARVVLALLFVDALVYAGLAAARVPGAALGVALAGGVVSSVLTVNITTIIQLTTPAELRGRVFALLGTITGSVAPLSLGVFGLVADLTGRNIPLIYSVCAAASLVIALLALANGQIRAFLSYVAAERPADDAEVQAAPTAGGAV